MSKRTRRVPLVASDGDAWGLPVFEIRADQDGGTEGVRAFAAAWRRYLAWRRLGAPCTETALRALPNRMVRKFVPPDEREVPA